MATFEDFLSEGKKIQIKRKYTENHPAQTVGKTANVRNAVLKAIADGVVTREEFNSIIAELSANSSQWASRNRKYFNVSEEGVKLSRWGRRILAELDETPKAAELNEKVKVTKDKFPYIEFKDGGKKYEVEFDQGDIIDDHGNEGKDWYYVGVDQFGDEWEIDVYTDFRDEPEDWFHDTIKRVDESKVTEGKLQDQVEELVRDLDTDEYEVFAFDNDIDPEDANQMMDFIMQLSNKDAKAIIKQLSESVVNEAKFVKEFDKAVLDAETEADVLKVYPDAEFYVGKMSHFFGELEKNLFFKAYYADWYKKDTGKSIKGDFKITTIYSEKGSRYVNLYVEESAVTENYEVIWSDGMRGLKKFRNERQARQYFDDKIKQKGMRDVALYRAGSGFHSTTQTEYVIAFWGDGTYLDNVSKRDADLAAKKVEESVVNEAFKFGTKNQYSMDDVNDGYGFWGTLEMHYDEKEVQDHWLVAFIHLTGNLGFSDAGALYFLNAKSGRWLADQVNDKEGMNFDLIDVMDAYAKSSQWKKWAKEYNDYAQEELAENNNTNMKTEFLFESFADFVGANFVNEALGSQIMADIFMSNKQGKAAAQNIKTLARGFYGMAKVALDKIQDEDFIVSNDPGKVFKNYGGPNHILFFISDNEKENPYFPEDSYGSLRTIPGGGILLAAMSGDRMFFANEWSRWSGGGTWTKQKKGDESQIGVSHRYRGWDATGLNNGKRISEVSDRVIVLNLDLVRQKYSTAQLRDARAAAKAGATAFQSDKDFKKANMARYQQILANKAASLPLDSMVEDAIDMLTKQIQAGLKKGEKTQWGEIKIGMSSGGREVKAKDASSHMSSILDDYQRYCDYVKQAEESEARYGERESYYERESKDYAKRVKDKINKIETFDYAW
jgi:hypothetical protein